MLKIMLAQHGQATHCAGVEEGAAVAGHPERSDDHQVHKMAEQERNHHQQEEPYHHKLHSLEGGERGGGRGGEGEGREGEGREGEGEGGRGEEGRGEGGRGGEGKERRGGRGEGVDVHILVLAMCPAH